MDRIYVSVWYGIIVFLLMLEAYTQFDGRDSTPALTRVLVQEVPWWVTMPMLVWLVIHFGSRYIGHPIL